MPRFPSQRRGRIILAAAAAQTVAAALAAAAWFTSGENVAALVLFGSWALLTVVALIAGGAVAAIVSLSSPPARRVGNQAPPQPEPEVDPVLKYAALLPLCQIAVGAVVLALASLGGFSMAESVSMGPGIGGALGTLAMIALGAYLALLCGALLVLITLVPIRMLWRAARPGSLERWSTQSRVAVAAMALVVLTVFPLAIGAVMGVASPSGAGPRATAMPLLLTVLGFDFSGLGYTVQHSGWLWAARICAIVMLLAVSATLLAPRSDRETRNSGRRPR